MVRGLGSNLAHVRRVRERLRVVRAAALGSGRIRFNTLSFHGLHHGDGGEIFGQLAHGVVGGCRREAAAGGAMDAVGHGAAAAACVSELAAGLAEAAQTKRAAALENSRCFNRLAGAVFVCAERANKSVGVAHDAPPPPPPHQTAARLQISRDAAPSPFSAAAADRFWSLSRASQCPSAAALLAAPCCSSRSTARRRPALRLSNDSPALVASACLECEDLPAKTAEFAAAAMPNLDLLQQLDEGPQAHYCRLSRLKVLVEKRSAKKIDRNARIELANQLGFAILTNTSL